MRFDDNRLAALLFGEHDGNLARIEQKLGVSLASRGNGLSIYGAPGSADLARVALNTLYHRLQNGLDVDMNEVDAALRHAAADVGTPERGARTDAVHGDLVVSTRRRRITPRSPRQAAYIRALREHELVFGLGPAGTGKTYLAVAIAVSLLTSGEVERIILSRPAVEAGERLGFLPGDMRDKVDPYMRPVYDALYDMLPGDRVARYLTDGDIEVAPLAFMRGRTLANAFVILDEAQNTTPVQMKMFLTRLGENSRLVVTGDLSQVDLPPGTRSGLRDALDKIGGIEGVAEVRFTDVDVVRHRLVTEIVRAYDQKAPPAEGGGEVE